MDLVRAVAFLLAATAALASALSLGGAFSDKLDLFAQAAPLWLATGIVALILQLLAGSGRPAIFVSLAAIVIPLSLMGPDLVARLVARRYPPAAQTLKVIQFNTWDRNRDPAATARWIEAQDADIVVLEEADEGNFPAALAAHYPFQTRCAGGCPTRILAKIAPADGGVISWPGLELRHRGAWATFGHGDDAFTVAGTHYVWPVPVGPQADQARRFAAAIGRFNRKTLIVAGDFNLAPWSFGLRRQDERFGIARLTHAIFTWPAGPISHWHLRLPIAVLAIDQIYAGPAWKPVSVVRGPMLGSDHYPVIAVLTR